MGGIWWFYSHGYRFDLDLCSVINLSEALYQVRNHLTSSSVRPLRKSRKRLRVYPKITNKPLSLHSVVPGLLCPQVKLAEVWLGWVGESTSPTSLLV